MKTPSRYRINCYIDEMNELEALSDRRKLSSEQSGRYQWLYRTIYLRSRK